MIDKKLLTEQRQDAVDAWRIAINLTVDASDHYGATSKEQADLALMWAVNAQATYTLSCGMYQAQPPTPIAEEDIRIDLYSSGVNGLKETMVRITHIPTGFVAESSDQKSQIANKAAALTELGERLKEVGWQG